jgi:SOS-response transcriptional repressor LexA
MAESKPNYELTTIEKEALRLYREHLEKYGAPPSLRQLGRQLDMVHSGVAHLLGRLRDKGYMQERKVTAVRLMLSSKGKKVAL